MKIPIFVSCPTSLNSDQQKSKDLIYAELDQHQLEARTLGQSDYPSEFPLKEVHSIGKHCAGGLVLGFTQFETKSGFWKGGTEGERRQTKRVTFPTPWNHLEAGILFGLRLPMMVFREPGITGGIFDPGVTDLFIHDLPAPPLSDRQEVSLRQVFLRWSAKVRDNYYNGPQPS